MTTLIIHPSKDIQQHKAFELAGSFLKTDPEQKILFQNPDLHFIDGSLTTSIGIETVRHFIGEMRFHPYQSPFQVGLILFANMLTEEAQNSLLKTLEEPTEMTRFILTTPHERFLLPTICSRCNCVFVKEAMPIKVETDTRSDNEIAKLLKTNIVDQFLFIEELVAQEKETRGKIAEFLIALTDIFRERMLKATRVGDTRSVQKNKQALKLISRAEQFIKRNTNKRVTLENLLLQLDVRIMNSL